MVSKHLSSKSLAINMRRRGASLRDVEKRLSVARSTLSYWFRGIKLSQTHTRRLQRRHELSLIKARKVAVKWHNAQKAQRLRTAETEAFEVLKKMF